MLCRMKLYLLNLLIWSLYGIVSEWMDSFICFGVNLGPLGSFVHFTIKSLFGDINKIFSFTKGYTRIIPPSGVDFV